MPGSAYPGGFTQLCACGCGENVTPKRYRSWVSKYIAGHEPIGHGREWSEEEIAFLRSNYERMTRGELARVLGRSAHSVASCAIKVLGLRKGGKRRTVHSAFERATPDRPADGCWPWHGMFTRAGYGFITYGKERWLAHRLSVYLANGRLARSADVLHRCDNKACVNPSHLYLGGDSANQRDVLTRTFRKNQKLRPDDVRSIRRRFRAGVSKEVLAAEYDCHITNIKAVITGRSWGWLP